jgi:hypothetical protein
MQYNESMQDVPELLIDVLRNLVRKKIKVASF